MGKTYIEEVGKTYTLIATSVNCGTMTDADLDHDLDFFDKCILLEERNHHYIRSETESATSV